MHELCLLKRSAMMNQATRCTRKHKNQTTDKDNNNIISHKRGHSPDNHLASSNLAKRVQLQALLTKDSEQPTCLAFGPNRKTEYPDHFFCDECDRWENRPIENKRINRKMKSYACIANHRSFLKPTAMNCSWSKMNIAPDAERENISTTSPQARINDKPKNTVADNLKLKLKERDKKIKELETKVHDLESKLEKNNNKLTQLRGEKKNLSSSMSKMCAEMKSIKDYEKPISIYEGLQNALQNTISRFYSRYSPARVGKMLRTRVGI